MRSGDAGNPAICAESDRSEQGPFPQTTKAPARPDQLRYPSAQAPLLILSVDGPWSIRKLRFLPSEMSDLRRAHRSCCLTPELSRAAKRRRLE